MRAVILSDNIPWGDLEGEWGLSVYITYRDKRILLDTGASGLFLENAKKLGVDLTQVDYAVLSHGHFDHSNGMEAFFETAPEAPFYVRPGCDACYFLEDGEMTYGGVPKAVTERFRDRMVFAEGDLSPSEGVWLIPHKTPGLSARGAADGMYVLRDGTLEPDGFAHEQSLVLETGEGLVIFNSCSHGGADTIIREVGETFPGKRVLGVLTEELGSLVHPFHTGLVMEF